MSLSPHDAVVAHVAGTRFPFPGQTTWPADYVTFVNAPTPKRAIAVDGRDYYPDIVIVDGTGRVREIGEVEMSVDSQAVARLKATSEAADTDTPTAVRHFFLYVPAGSEAAGQVLLDGAGISYAGVRGFAIGADGKIEIRPFVTTGDQYDHQ
jgi:hypothetical protein